MQRQNTISLAGHGVMLRRAALFFTFVAMLIFAAQAAVGDTTKTRLFLNLTSDDVWSNQMAFGYANKVMDQGHEVVVFLNVRAVKLAHRSIPQPVDPQRELTARDELTALMERGARVFVCPGCTLKAGMSQEDWIDGVEPGGPELIALQMDPLSMIVSY